MGGFLGRRHSSQHSRCWVGIGNQEHRVVHAPTGRRGGNGRGREKKVEGEERRKVEEGERRNVEGGERRKVERGRIRKVEVEGGEVEGEKGGR